MASTINALSTGSGGLITTGDASGQLELQANGSTKLTVSSSGVNIAGGITSPLIVTGNSTAGAELRLPEDTDNGSNYVALKAADSLASNLTFTLPSADGTSGQVLQTNGSGTLSFATPAGGSWTYLSTVTANNSATADIETTFNSTYDVYAIIASNITVQNDAANLRLRLKIGGSYLTASYKNIATDLNSNQASTYNGTSGTASIDWSLSVGNAAGEFAVGVMYVFNPSSTSIYKSIQGHSTCCSSTGNAFQTTFSAFNESSTAALTGVQVFASSGNLVTGTFRLYGIKNS